MDLPPHGWDKDVEVGVEAVEGEEENDEEEEKECAEQRGKGCSVESSFRGEGTWPPGGCSHCAASCERHDNKGMRQCFNNCWQLIK